MRAAPPLAMLAILVPIDRIDPFELVLASLQLACRPANLTASAHNSMSLQTISANSSGLFPNGSMPKFINCSFVLGSLAILAASSAIRFTMDFGVPAGAIKPHHDIVLNPGKPDSAM